MRWETEASDNWSEGGDDLNCKGGKEKENKEERNGKREEDN